METKRKCRRRRTDADEHAPASCPAPITATGYRLLQGTTVIPKHHAESSRAAAAAAEEGIRDVLYGLRLLKRSLGLSRRRFFMHDCSIS